MCIAPPQGGLATMPTKTAHSGDRSAGTLLPRHPQLDHHPFRAIVINGEMPMEKNTPVLLQVRQELRGNIRSGQGRAVGCVR